MKLLITCLTILAVVHESLSCSCLPKTTKEKICSADFVVKVNMKDYVNPSGDINELNAYYRATINSVYWGEGLGNGKSRLYTAGNGALCGISTQLPRGKYVVAGSQNGAELRLNSCTSVIRTWNDMVELVAGLVGANIEARNDNELQAMVESMCSK